MLTFQQIIFKLQTFWADKGCTVIQPFDMEVGAGTSHPATCLRALGPEPWFAAYVQPSRRPKDGRYGDNPNRRTTKIVISNLLICHYLLLKVFIAKSLAYHVTRR